MDLSPVLVGIATVLVVGLALWAVAVATRRALTGPARLPLFDRLANRGLRPAMIEACAGAEGLGHAVRRCVLCAERPACAAGAAVDCPNEPLLRRALGKET